MYMAAEYGVYGFGLKCFRGYLGCFAAELEGFRFLRPVEGL